MGKMEERHERILDLLAARPVCTVAEMSRLLNVTAETIRKDLDALEKQEKVTRIHGGAALSERQGSLLPYSTRAGLHSREKRRVASAACSLITEGDMLLLEGSTTVTHLCESLREKPRLLRSLSIVTNSVITAQTLEMGKLCNRLFLLGGWVRNTEGVAYGASTLAQLETLHVDKAFLSGAALNEALELSAYDEADLSFQQCAMRRAAQAILLIDSGKYPVSATHRVCTLTDFSDVVTDIRFESTQCDALEKKDCRLLHA